MRRIGRLLLAVMGGMLLALVALGSIAFAQEPGGSTPPTANPPPTSPPDGVRPARKIANVKVTVGKTTRIDVALGAGDEKQIAVQEVEVVATPDTATEAVQIVQRQKSAVVSDGISAQQIARSPDTSASDSIKRVVAATVQDNRYVVIRGLGGRYSATLLNGVPLPSPDPDTPSAPL